LFFIKVSMTQQMEEKIAQLTQVLFRLLNMYNQQKQDLVKLSLENERLKSHVQSLLNTAEFCKDSDHTYGQKVNNVISPTNNQLANHEQIGYCIQQIDRCIALLKSKG
jgi:hypothetical protein